MAKRKSMKKSSSDRVRFPAIAETDHVGDDSILTDNKTGPPLVPKIGFLSLGRIDLFIVFGIMIVVSVLLGVVYILYKFMKEDRARWKQLSSEIVKHRAQFEQMSSQMRQIMDQQKNTDHEWVEEIKKIIHSNNEIRCPISKPTNTTRRPTIVIDTAPVIMSEQDMDDVLAAELQELRQTSPDNDAHTAERIESVSIDDEGRC